MQSEGVFSHVGTHCLCLVNNELAHRAIRANGVNGKKIVPKKTNESARCLMVCIRHSVQLYNQYCNKSERQRL